MRGFQKGITHGGRTSGSALKVVGVRIRLSGVGIRLSGGGLDFSVKSSPLDFA